MLRLKNLKRRLYLRLHILAISYGVCFYKLLRKQHNMKSVERFYA